MICLASGPGLTQGIVDFRNQVLPGDHKIYDFNYTPLVGTNFFAQLYYGSDVWTLRPATNSPARFLNVTTGSSAAGIWVGGGYRTLEGFSPGTVVTMAVKVWDSWYGSTAEEAGGNGGLAILARPFTYTVPPSGANPTNHYMYGFRPCLGLDCCSFTWAPRFDAQPQSQTVAVGSDVTLSANVGGEPCFGDWRFNGTNSLGRGQVWVGRSNYLVLQNVQPSQSGSYQLLLGNYGSFVTSQIAVLTIVIPPQLGLVARAGSEFRFYVPAESGRSFAVETTTNLSLGEWMPVHTNTAPFWFTNSTTDADRQRFYRAVLR